MSCSLPKRPRRLIASDLARQRDSAVVPWELTMGRIYAHSEKERKKINDIYLLGIAKD